MLSSLVAPILLLLFGELALPAQADDCTTFPSWTIKHFRSNATDAVGSDGTASFSLTNNLSGVTDDLKCKLEANYRCTIAGTPSDKNLTVTFAIRTASLQISLDEVLNCPDRTTPLHVIGNEGLDLNCTEVMVPGGPYSCSLEEDTIQGAPVELAPGSN